jgi:6-pyruvoyltetrahydropterin/6-carboxytetrahydropterin synthase
LHAGVQSPVGARPAAAAGRRGGKRRIRESAHVERYSVRVTKDYLVFCSAHFITYENSKCERVHGHNYRLAAELAGPLDEDSLVIDFIALKRILRKLTDELDHRVLLPRRSPVLRVEEGEEEVIVRYGDKKRWVFPREDAIILPIANTTAELLATWIADRLEEELRAGGYGRFERMVIEVEESHGQSAFYERRRE